MTLPHEDGSAGAAAAGSASASPSYKVCATCSHYRTRGKLVLFDSDDLQAPGVLKAQTEWDQEERQRAQAEKQRYEAKQPFDYEPHHYAWCAFYSHEDDVKAALAGDEAKLAELTANRHVSINPVTGDINPLYILCRVEERGREVREP